MAEVRLEKLETMSAAHIHVLSDQPEEDASSKIMEWAKSNGYSDNGSALKGARLFGRNTYPTDNPEPHGYELFLTGISDLRPEGEIDIKDIPGGLYAVMRFQNLARIGDAWRTLWEWVDQSHYEYIGLKKGDFGWVNGFEEHLNWQEKRPPNEWIFDLWVRLK